MMKEAGSNELGGETGSCLVHSWRSPLEPAAVVMEAVYCRRSRVEERPGPEEIKRKASSAWMIIENQGAR